MHGVRSLPATKLKIAAPATGGLRERNKADKLQKIRAAARELFIENGYEDTTVREIAQRAGVGLGTLFAYAADKRDLLFLIFNDELEAVTASAFQAAKPELSFLDQLVAVFRKNYEFFGRQPALSRFMLRELTFYVAAPETNRFHAIRERLQTDLAALVARAKAEKRLLTTADPALIARVLAASFAIEIRRWIGNDKPNLAQGVAALREVLQLLITGLEPIARVF
jgi:AcrR family transcriptional regulator